MCVGKLFARKNQTYFLSEVLPPFCSFLKSKYSRVYVVTWQEQLYLYVTMTRPEVQCVGMDPSSWEDSHFPAITHGGPLSISPSKEYISLLHMMSQLLHCTCGNQLETEFSHSLARLHSSSEDKKIASTFTGLPWQLVKLGQDVGADNMA